MQPKISLTQLKELAGQDALSQAAFDTLMAALAARRDRAVGQDALLGDYAEAVAESIFTDGPTPDCLSCGACCAYFHQIPVQLTDPTPKRLTWAVGESADEPPAHWLRREPLAGRCVALNGEIGGRVACAIYPLRPRACRAFEAGSDRCHAVRRLYGLEPPPPPAERERRARLLKAAGEDACADAEETGWDGAALSDEARRVEFLRELIAYNREKLAEILMEMEGLLALFGAAGDAACLMSCRSAMRGVQADANNLSQEVKRSSLQAEAAAPEEISRRLLAIGNTSQEALERAAERLAALADATFILLQEQVHLRQG